MKTTAQAEARDAPLGGLDPEPIGQRLEVGLPGPEPARSRDASAPGVSGAKNSSMPSIRSMSLFLQRLFKMALPRAS